MRTLNLASDFTTASAGSTTAIDLEAQKVPFLPGYTAVAVFTPEGVTNATITIEGADDSGFTAGVVTYATLDLDPATTVSKNTFAEITMDKQFIRVTVAIGATPAGTVSVDLLGN